MKSICRLLLFLLLLFASKNPPLISQELPRATPEEVGLSTERLGRLNTLMQDYVSQKKLAGVVTMVARHGKVVHVESFGLMDIEANKPMQTDAIFRIYSMTKPITSVAVMMLYEEGHFQLNDPVSQFIPALKNPTVYKGKTEAGFEVSNADREITIRDLLTHTSGLTYWRGDTPVNEMYQKANLFDPHTTLEVMVQKLGLIPLRYAPGSTWEYSISTDVLGYLVEVVSGIPFEQFLDERIIKPLGMVDTSFQIPTEKMNRLAAIYRYTKDLNPPLERMDTGGREIEPAPFFASGGGGLLSTASDYMRFCQMLLNGGELDEVRLLSPKTVELMTMNHLPTGWHPTDKPGSGFGLGFQVVTDRTAVGQLWSEGTFRWGGAAATTFWIDPKEDLIGVLMTQLRYIPYPLRQHFRMATYQAIVD